MEVVFQENEVNLDQLDLLDQLDQSEVLDHQVNVGQEVKLALQDGLVNLVHVDHWDL